MNSMRPRPVGPGTQKITQDSAERDYQSKLLAAKRQHGQPNPFVAGEQQGIQKIFSEGSAEAVAGSRDDKYGSVSVMPQQVLEGHSSNFSQGDTPSNSPVEEKTSGVLGGPGGGVSATTNPHEDTSQFDSKLQERLAMYNEAGNAYHSGMNRRDQTMRA